MSRSRWWVGLGLVAWLGTSCGGDTPTSPVTPTPVTPTPPVVASLFIDSNLPTLYVGGSAQLAFEVRDSKGAALTGRTVTWTSSAVSVVTVSSSGVLTGVSAGSATITGNVEGVSAARTVTVLPVPQTSIALSPDVAMLARGVDFTLATTLTDADGKPATGQHTVTYASANPALATVSATGVVHPVANGAVDITATVDGKQQAVARVTVLDPRTITGVVATSDGGPLQNLAFTARFNAGGSASETFRTTVDPATGTFSLVMPLLGANGPSVEFFVDVASGTTRGYHPSWMRLGNGVVPTNARILLIPHAITPDSGTYAGSKFDVSLNEAFIPVCTDTSNANCQGYWPSYFLTGIKNWSDAARPIPVAFDRTTSPVAAADSMGFWDVIRAMEADVGRKLYRPANFRGYTSTGYTRDTVLVSIDPSLVGFAGYSNWNWDGQGVIYQARVRFSQARWLTQSSVVTHELNHVLGFHHTCRWQTVMGGYGCPQEIRMSGTDVAYFHLAEQVRRQSTTFKPTWSINEGLQGTRVLELGLPASDALPLALAAHFLKTPAPGADAAP